MSVGKNSENLKANTRFLVLFLSGDARIKKNRKYRTKRKNNKN